MTAALSELHEELGLEVDPSDLKLLTEWRSSTRPAPDFINNSFNTLYLLRTDKTVSDFILQSSEVSAVKYFSLSELHQLAIGSNPDFVPHPHAYSKLFETLA